MGQYLYTNFRYGRDIPTGLTRFFFNAIDPSTNPKLRYFDLSLSERLKLGWTKAMDAKGTIIECTGSTGKAFTVVSRKIIQSLVDRVLSENIRWSNSEDLSVSEAWYSFGEIIREGKDLSESALSALIRSSYKRPTEAEIITVITYTGLRLLASELLMEPWTESEIEPMMFQKKIKNAVAFKKPA